ncbi:MAG: AAA family ATPase [Lentisphaerae bacterium]|nr:AAA family ATPase [Lentisphaerota bacterium]
MNRRSFFSCLGMGPLVAASGTVNRPGRIAPANTRWPALSSADHCDTEATVTHCRDYIGEVLGSARKNGLDPVAGLRTYFRELDCMIRGLRKGDLVLLAGRPGMGTTTLALNIACRVAMGGWDTTRQEDAKPVLISPMSVWPPALVLSMLSGYAAVEVRRLRRGQLSPQEVRSLKSKAAELESAPIYLGHGPTVGLSLGELHTVAAMAKREAPGLALLVVDVAEITGEPGDTRTRPNLDLVCRNLKHLAQKLDLPIIAIAGLTRGAKGREGHVPRLCDLPGGRLVHRPADIVILLHHAELYCPGARTCEADLIVAKNRHGPTGFARVAFRRDLDRFDDPA